MFSLLLLSFATLGLSKVVTLDWDITWVNASPDGHERAVIGINGQWPPPPLEVDVNDTIIANVRNSLGNETTGIHWHGMWQRGSNEMDGAGEITQCGIPPGSTFRYEFVAYPAGTHWCHSHEKGQYPDGLRLPMIVHDNSPESPKAQSGATREIILPVSDWYHDEIPYLLREYLGPENRQGIMPSPDSNLVNDTTRPTIIDMKPGEKVYIRIVNMGALAFQNIEFDQHDFQVVAIDGVPVKPTTWKGLRITPGQRYDIVLTGLDKPSGNYAFAVQQAITRTKTLGILNYGGRRFVPNNFSVDESLAGDDFTLQPTTGEKILEPVDQRIVLDSRQLYYKDVGSRITLGNDSYIAPETPSLYTALTTGPAASNPFIYGQVNAYVLQPDSIVEIVINSASNTSLDLGGVGHPMHLHGHTFQVVSRSDTTFDESTAVWSETPMVRDVVNVAPSGSVVIRLKANNPGVWLLHCHVDFHLSAGMAAVMIEAPEQLQRSGIEIPSDHLAACRRQDITPSGNCAGSPRLLDTASCRQFERHPSGALITGDHSKVANTTLEPIRRRSMDWHA
ncbi:conidial pigment biosynthesis oxidase Abr1/brown 1 [Phyllosticta citrichinensis]|uniref:Conidial pigment biosynthesis oxidase Abr1/brown 1 n=1 Tax=Phyllosticta citrichinensis TaxID=1130410 RepID=A0ABR1XY54_9PEZI